MDEALIQKAAALLNRSSSGVAFTGAGISTPSGIPDFRSPISGLWNNIDTYEVASVEGFRKNPSAFYDWVRPLINVIQNARPDSAHQTLADWEAVGKLSAVITQNIDGLHTAAGSKTVFELHGHIREATCQKCGNIAPTKPLLAELLTTGMVPRCNRCNGVLKPNVILFGELLPQGVINASMQAAKRADLMLVVGSSLEVSPANDLPLLALNNGAKLIIINREPTFIDRRAHVVIHTDAAQALPAIQKAMENVG